MSPPITLFHLERRTHTSKVGGFFVLLMLFLCISYILFLFYDLAAHKRITLLFHKKFEFEAGYYSFNSSSIFHFIQIFHMQIQIFMIIGFLIHVEKEQMIKIQNLIYLKILKILQMECVLDIILTVQKKNIIIWEIANFHGHIQSMVHHKEKISI